MSIALHPNFAHFDVELAEQALDFLLLVPGRVVADVDFVVSPVRDNRVQI